MGPYGGDARSIVADPKDSRHLYMGTATGWVFESHDGGATWIRLSQIGKRDDLIIDHILTDPTDPQRLIIGAWIVDRPDGGLFISADGGKSWYDQAEMHGQSIRSLARAPSNPNELVAGTLQGVFRSMDDGKHWVRISPAGSTEIHEIESVAFDPVNPDIIYAGTWHLPWKTADGGKTWTNIKEGIIEDSDVFSIIVDPKRPNIVYASACSGIYKSTDSGLQFKGGVTLNKTQGIPATARRTRKLMQDPNHPETVFAGTTQGLYRTVDGGIGWARLSSPEVIVNDVFVDPKNSNHVLLATDRAGVLTSQDGGVTLSPSNAGFSARQISSFASDPQHPGTVYVGVVNDKEAGGVFQSVDGGIRWQQQSLGLDGRDIFSLGMTPDGTLLAGTGHGILRLENGAWAESNVLQPAAPPAVAAHHPATPAPARPTRLRPLPQPTTLDSIVYSIAGSSQGVYAGTSNGLLYSSNGGHIWTPMSSLQMPETHFLATQKSIVMVAGLKRIALSMDDGKTWDAVALPTDLTQIGAVALDELNNLWVGGREGVWYSTDYGLNWKVCKDLYMTEVDGIYFDAASHRVLVTASNNTFAFAAHLPDYKISYWDTGWDLRFLRPVGDHLIGATLFDGMVVQPKMVDSAVVDTKTAVKK